MVTYSKTSILVSDQLPGFVRADHPTFTSFLEAYYQYLEQSSGTMEDGKVIERSKNFLSYLDIDATLDELATKLYDEYLHGFPEGIIADRNLILKHSKDFFRAKGTEKALRFLMRVLFNEEIEIYYPKRDVLRASDGKWYIQKSLRISNTEVANVSNSSIVGLEKYVGTRIVGSTSNASATVESVNRFFQTGTQVDELIISGIRGEFDNGEMIATHFIENGDILPLQSNVFAGVINSITIVDGGLNYNVGDPVTIVSSTGNSACVVVGKVSSGEVLSISVLNGGAGYKVNDIVMLTGGSGSGANAVISLVNEDETYHPNTYNIYYSAIDLEANTPLNNAVYSNLASANVNTAIANALSSFVYSNTGPAQQILIITPGSGYVSAPTVSIVGNTFVRNLGILGRMEILDGGLNYANNDIITFTNAPGGYGTGAVGKVAAIEANGKIKRVAFTNLPGFLIGGSGYEMNYLPTANVSSGTGNGANVIVTALLGYGGDYYVANSSIGAIERVVILNGGVGYYSSNTIVDMTGYGDSNANLTASVVEGVYTYPGRYLNDDGHLSSYNFLQNRDYYQNFSYVVRIKESINNYRKSILDLVHPSGMKLWGEYTDQDTSDTIIYESPTSQTIVYKTGTYVMANTVATVTLTDHTLTPNTNVYLDEITGELPNGIFNVVSVGINTFNVVSTIANTSSGNVSVGVIIT